MNKSWNFWRLGYWIAGIVLAITSEAYGEPAHFEGKLVIEFKEAGNRLVLLEDYRYFDQNYKMWTARKGLITDGASIPRWAWSFIGSPLGAPYVNAAIIHDQYCVLRTEKPEDAHKMFYDAMIVAGVDKLKAKLMYAAVYAAGPWWDWRTIENARQAFQNTYYGDAWAKQLETPHLQPPKEMFKKGTDGKPLICNDGCSWTDLVNLQDDWISTHVPIAARKALSTQEQDAVTTYVQTHARTVDEIKSFVDHLRNGAP